MLVPDIGPASAGFQAAGEMGKRLQRDCFAPWPSLTEGKGQSGMADMKAKDMEQTEKADARGLRLMALDAEDLAVISDHVEEAVVKIGDMAFLPQAKRFVFVMSRLDWEETAAARRMTGVHFDRVSRVTYIGFRQDERDGVLNLLRVSFTADREPSGTIVMTFSDGAAIRLEVECIEARLSDLAPLGPDAG